MLHDGSPAIVVSDLLPQELLLAIDQAYEPAGLRVTDSAQRENESTEYDACRLSLDNAVVVFRVAKTTPTKIGQFVTIWKRSKPGAEIAPLDSNDGVDFVVVSVSDVSHQGQFIFNQKTLLKHGVMSVCNVGGKRAMRVYPPWCMPKAKDAIKNQQWQLRHFLPLTPGFSADPEQVRKLFVADL